MRKLNLNQQTSSRVFVLFICFLFIAIRTKYELNGPSKNIDNYRQSRRLLSGVAPATDDRCTHSKGAVEEFPPDYFSQQQREKGGIIFHILVMFYMFGLLAVVCEDYFVLSLYHICSRLRLDKDVAGATFMAIGSSAPTLFIAIVSIFFTESAGDVGLGTVVGSTIFNTLFIIAICAMATNVPMKITRWPLLRDSFVYTLGTVTLVLTVRDREVQWWEASIFIVIYILYIVIMYFNKSLGTFFTNLAEKCFGSCGEIDDDSELVTTETANTLDDKQTINKQIQTSLEDHSQGSVNQVKDEYQHTRKSPLEIPKGIIPKFVWFLGFPVMILFYITIPPCCKQRWSEWFLVTFAMSVMWMGALSYILVWMVCIIGDTFDIPDCIMGMTFLAAGSSIPDVMASVIVIRQGMVDMALSNAIGSNVFDMLCLGVPWLLKTTVMEPGTSVQIESQSIMISALLLIGSIVFTVLAIHLNDWKLNVKLGIIFLIVYIVFITVATLLEFLACPCQIESFMP